MELTWRDIKYRRGKFSLVGSLLSWKGLKLEWAFPQLPAVLFVWTATGHKSGQRCPPFHRSNADRGSSLRWNAFAGGKKHHFRLKANVKIKMGKSLNPVQLGGIQYKSRPHILSSFFSVSCSKAVEAWFWFSEQRIFYLCYNNKSDILLGKFILREVQRVKNSVTCTGIAIWWLYNIAYL